MYPSDLTLEEWKTIAHHFASSAIPGVLEIL